MRPIWIVVVAVGHFILSVWVGFAVVSGDEFLGELTLTADVLRWLIDAFSLPLLSLLMAWLPASLGVGWLLVIVAINSGVAAMIVVVGVELSLKLCVKSVRRRCR